MTNPTATEKALECVNLLIPDLAEVSLNDLSAYCLQAKKISDLFELGSPDIKVTEIRTKALALCKSYFQILDEAPSLRDVGVKELKTHLEKSKAVLAKFEELIDLCNQFKPSIVDSPVLKVPTEVMISSNNEPILHTNGVVVAPVTEAAAFNKLFNHTSTSLTDWSLPQSSVQQIHHDTIVEYGEVASMLALNFPNLMTIHLEQGIDSITIASLLTLQVEWQVPGEKSEIYFRNCRNSENTIAGVRMEDGGIDFHRSNALSEIFKELGKEDSQFRNEDIVAEINLKRDFLKKDLSLKCYMAQVGDLGPVTQEQILQYIKRIASGMKGLDKRKYEVGSLDFPMVDLKFKTELPPIVGTACARLEQLVTKANFDGILKMNEKGALAQAKFKMMVLSAASEPSKTVVSHKINDNFVCWFELSDKTGEKQMLFGAYVTRDSMKSPANLDPELKVDD